MTANAKVSPIRASKTNSPVHPSQSKLYAAGKALRDKCPRTSHAGWNAPHGRPDPVQLVLQADMGRMPELLPQKHRTAVCSAGNGTDVRSDVGSPGSDKNPPLSGDETASSKRKGQVFMSRDLPWCSAIYFAIWHPRHPSFSRCKILRCQ